MWWQNSSDVPEGVLAAMEASDEPLPDAVAAAWDAEFAVLGDEIPIEDARQMALAL